MFLFGHYHLYTTWDMVGNVYDNMLFKFYSIVIVCPLSSCFKYLYISVITGLSLCY